MKSPPLLVLAGGFGTRIRALVNDVPKALAPVGSVPFLYLQIENWIAQGLQSFIFLLHHHSDLIIEFLKIEGKGLLKDCEVQWLVEPTPMDTGGAVAYAVQRLTLSDNFLLTNSDTWLGTGIWDLMRSRAPAIVVISVPNATRYGQVQFDDEFIISVFREKDISQRPGWINAGLSHLNVDIFKNWDGSPFSLERVLFEELAGLRLLKAVPISTDFIDIGVPDDYLRFCRWIEAGRKGRLCG